MKFDTFDKQMRKYEQSLDQIIPLDNYMVARLDGKGFSKLTKETLDLRKPFDEKFRGYLVEAVKSLFNTGFEIVYAYIESDEISLLFSKNATLYNRKVRKYNSILAAEMSVNLTQILGRKAIFDCRIIPLPSLQDVTDYFLWRQEDSHRNSIYAHCYYKLLETGMKPVEATNYLKNKLLDDKIELLAKNNICLNAIPNWEMYGYGVYNKEVLKEGYNPIKQIIETTTRKMLYVDYELSHGSDYTKFITDLLEYS